MTPSEAAAAELEWRGRSPEAIELYCDHCDLTWSVVTNGWGELDDEDDWCCPRCEREGEYT